MDRRRFIRLAGGGVVFAAGTTAFAGCSSEVPQAAMASWGISLLQPANAVVPAANTTPPPARRMKRRRSMRTLLKSL